jgi:hypothetical protein
VIQKLRENGYSYGVICETLAEKGVLPSGESPKHLCSAFLRETKRKGKRTVEAGSSNRSEVKKTGANSLGSNKGVEGVRQTAPQKPASPDRQELVVNPDNTFNILPSGLSESDIKDIEQKLKLNPKTYDTGTGFKITKHANGSLDYE